MPPSHQQDPQVLLLLHPGCHTYAHSTLSLLLLLLVLPGTSCFHRAKLGFLFLVRAAVIYAGW
jgi:hypothetical protein